MDVLSARVTQLIRHLREDRLAGAERRKKGNIEIRARGGIFLKRRAFRYGRRRSEQGGAKLDRFLKQCTLLSPVYWGSSLKEIWWYLKATREHFQLNASCFLTPFFSTASFEGRSIFLSRLSFLMCHCWGEKGGG